MLGVVAYQGENMVLATETPMTTVDATQTTSRDDLRPGREEQIELVYRLHGRSVYRFLLRVTLGNRREAEDLLQETLLRAWQLMQASPVDAEALRPWLFTVARRLSIDSSRARSARPSEVILGDIAALPAVRDDTDQMLVALTVRQGLMSLNAEHRRVLVAIFYYGRSVREAAEMLGIPEGTVKSRMFYALRSLRTLIDEGSGRP
jgi:RNA polymerase sigma-70 factor, ECF subfamily